jgi:hypothetical protein
METLFVDEYIHADRAALKGEVHSERVKHDEV